MARPTKYKKEFIAEVDKYLKKNVDKEVEVVKQRSAKKGYEIFERKLTVQLPTLDGFALFIEVSRRVLNKWGAKNPEFMQALGKIKKEQKKRLLNMGLSGDYNSTIAKLILSSNHGMVEKTETELTGEVGLRIKPNKYDGIVAREASALKKRSQKQTGESLRDSQ